MKSSNPIGVFENEDKLYYATESGVVFSLSWKRLADIYEQEEPFPVQIVVGLPLGATKLPMKQDNPNKRSVEEWVDAMDHHIGALAAELAEYLGRRPSPTRPASPAKAVNTLADEPMSPVAAPLGVAPVTPMDAEPATSIAEAA